MANSSISTFLKRKTLHTLSTSLLLLLLFLLFLFLFTKTVLESKLSLYTTNLISSNPDPILPSFPRSTNIHNQFDNITKPISSESRFPEEISKETILAALPILSKPDLDIQKNSSDDFNGERTEPISLNEEINEPISLKSDFDEEKSEIWVDNGVAEKLRNCDVYKGRWVKDENYPLYKPGSCPYVDEAFDCQNNGRPDFGYLNWRWKPDDCDLPRFNATDFLLRLRGKRLMLVGDSMNRNQFESLLCLLREALPNKTKMYEVHGWKITKGRGFYIFQFEDYNCTVEFVRSHFLVREGVRVNGQGNSNPTLSIDRIDKSAGRWLRADILVFNTGHWWTHGKTSRGKNYYKEGDYVYPRFDPVKAYRKAITTWAKWINEKAKNKIVFYRGYSNAHFRGGDWDSGGTCNGETEPVLSGPILDSYPTKMTILEEVIKELEVPVFLLNVTHITNYRKDGHPSVYGRNVTGMKKVSTRKQDCSHWCLPGVPDTWNELIYTSLVAQQT